jgi:uncharacterized BrkB/YihY/UPF0761 family membrane protein
MKKTLLSGLIASVLVLIALYSLLPSDERKIKRLFRELVAK